jgi:hypothetical protein
MLWNNNDNGKVFLKCKNVSSPFVACGCVLVCLHKHTCIMEKNTKMLVSPGVEVVGKSLYLFPKFYINIPLPLLKTLIQRL